MFPTLNEAVSVWINFGNPFPFAMVIWGCRFWVNIHCLFEVLLFVEIAMVIMHNNTLQTVGFLFFSRTSLEYAKIRTVLQSGITKYFQNTFLHYISWVSENWVKQPAIEFLNNLVSFHLLGSRPRWDIDHNAISRFKNQMRLEVFIWYNVLWGYA